MADSRKNTIQAEIQLDYENFNKAAQKSFNDLLTKANDTIDKIQEKFDKLKVNIDISSLTQLKDQIETLCSNDYSIKVGDKLVADFKEATDTLEKVKTQVTELTKELNKNTNKNNSPISFEGLSAEIQNALSGFKDLENILKSIKDLESTIARAGKVASSDDISAQWSNLEKKLAAIADASGKINLNKQKKDVQELANEYQKYIQMGGKNPLSDLSSNTQTVKKLTQAYDNLIQVQTQAKSNETKQTVVPKQEAAPSATISDKQLSDIKSTVASLQKEIASFNTALNNIDKKSENAESLATVLERISKALIEIDKCINVPDIFAGMEVSNTAGTNITNLAIGLEFLKEQLDNLGSLSNEGKAILTQINELLSQAEALRNLATIVKTNISKVKKEVAKENGEPTEAEIKRQQRAQEAEKKRQQRAQERNAESARSIIKNFNEREQIAGNSFNETKQYTEAKRAIDALNQSLEHNGKITKEDISNAKELFNEYAKITKTGNTYMGQASNSKEAFDLSENYFKGQGLKIKDSGNFVKNAQTGVEKLTKTIVNSKGELEKWEIAYNNGVVTMSNKTKTLQKDVSGLSKIVEEFKKKFKDITMYMTAIFINPYRMIGYIKQGVDVVRDFDSAFTEMRKVSDESTKSLKEYQKESFNTARQTGETAKQIQDSTADWMRLGNPQPKLRIAPLYGNI